MIGAGALREPFQRELRAATGARDAGDPTEEWRRLERAHVVSQPSVTLHVRAHLHMIAAATRRRDGRELLGQVARVAVAGPASLIGRYPVGNTGGASVPATRRMPIPADLTDMLAPFAPDRAQ